MPEAVCFFLLRFVNVGSEKPAFLEFEEKRCFFHFQLMKSLNFAEVMKHVSPMLRCHKARPAICLD